MVDSTKKTTRSEGSTPTRPGEKTNTNTSADYGSKPITEYFPSIPKTPESQVPPPSTQEVVDGWDDLSAASQPPQPDFANNPYSPLATDHLSDDEESVADNADTNPTNPTPNPPDAVAKPNFEPPPPRTGVTFGHNSVKTIPPGHNPSGRNPYLKKGRATTGRGASTRSTGRGQGWFASRSTAQRQCTRFTLRFNVTPTDTSDEGL